MFYGKILNIYYVLLNIFYKLSIETIKKITSNYYL